MSEKNVVVCSPEEAQRVIAKLGLAKKYEGESAVPFTLKGHIDLTIREEDGSLVEHISQPNLITDFGLRMAMSGWHRLSTPQYGTTTNYLCIGLSPSTETPHPGRYTLADNGSSYPAPPSTNGGPFYNLVGSWASYTAATMTWTYFHNFTAGTARQIGTIACFRRAAQGIETGLGMLCGYSLLNPVRTITATQTVELLYRVTFVPSDSF